MDHRIILRGKGSKELCIFHQVCRCRGGHFAACLYMSKYIGRVDGDTVQQDLFSHQDVHGHQGDAPLLYQLSAQVAGAVGGDFDLHVEYPSFFVPFIKKFALLKILVKE